MLSQAHGQGKKQNWPSQGIFIFPMNRSLKMKQNQENEIGAKRINSFELFVMEEKGTIVH